jgi:hypothetical protein
MAEILLAAGADPNASVFTSGSALFRAYQTKDRPLVDLLEAHGGFLDAVSAGYACQTEAARQLLADEEINALLRELKSSLGDGAELGTDIHEELGWRVYLSYPGYDEPGSWVKVIFASQCKREKERILRNSWIVLDYFGHEPKPCCDSTMAACTSIDHIIYGKKKGKIARLVLAKYGRHIDELKRVGRHVVCPYVEVCSEDHPVDEKNKFLRKGCAFCVEMCPHIKSEHVPEDDGTIRTREWWE